MQLRKTWSNRLLRPLRIRRIVGDSMLPTLSKDAIVWATGLFRNVHAGDLVILDHHGMEKIKRIEAIAGDELFVLGDNPGASTDSRSFGWLPLSAVQAKVIWPRSR